MDDVVAYGCAEGHYNPAATLLSPAGEKVVKQLFARGFHYQFDYAALACMLALYLPASAYCCGIACSTGEETAQHRTQMQSMYVFILPREVHASARRCKAR